MPREFLSQSAVDEKGMISLLCTPTDDLLSILSELEFDTHIKVAGPGDYVAFVPREHCLYPFVCAHVDTVGTVPTPDQIRVEGDKLSLDKDKLPKSDWESKWNNFRDEPITKSKSAEPVVDIPSRYGLKPAPPDKKLPRLLPVTPGELDEVAKDDDEWIQVGMFEYVPKYRLTPSELAKAMKEYPPSTPKAAGKKSKKAASDLLDWGSSYKQTILGGDNRCGVAVCLELLKAGLPYAVGFFNHEEVGALGSRQFGKDHPEILKHSSCFLGLDWIRGSEFAAYGYATPKGTDIIKAQFEFEEHGWLAYTDCAILAAKTKKPSYAISVGYFNQHSQSEYIVLTETRKTLAKLVSLVETGKDFWLDFDDIAEVEAYLQKKGMRPTSWGGKKYAGVNDPIPGKKAVEGDWDEREQARWDALVKAAGGKTLAKPCKGPGCAEEKKKRGRPKGLETLHVPGVDPSDVKIFICNSFSAAKIFSKGLPWEFANPEGEEYFDMYKESGAKIYLVLERSDVPGETARKMAVFIYPDEGPMVWEDYEGGIYYDDDAESILQDLHRFYNVPRDTFAPYTDAELAALDVEGWLD